MGNETQAGPGAHRMTDDAALQSSEAPKRANTQAGFRWVARYKPQDQSAAQLAGGGQ